MHFLLYLPVQMVDRDVVFMRVDDFIGAKKFRCQLVRAPGALLP